MILARLFETLFDEGITVIATSNRKPDDLYKDGLQRDRFLPFIDLIKERLEILELGGEHDYRLDRLRNFDVYLTPSGAWANAKLDEAFRALSGGAEGEPRVLRTQGRDVDIPRAAPGVAMAHYLDWCARPMGAADFLCIAEHFHTVIVADIPRMGPDSQDKAARFVTMIDTFYEKKVKFICSAATAPSRTLRRGRRRLRVPAHRVAADGDAEPGISRPGAHRLIVIVARPRPSLGSASRVTLQGGRDMDGDRLIYGAENGLSRRAALTAPVVVGSTFALAVQPVQAQTMIVTPADGLTAGAVKVKTKDGKDMDAYRAMPASGQGFGTILVVQEIFGVHAHIADMCRRFAKAGYYAIAPELYFRQGDPKTYTEIPKLISEIVSKVPDEQVMGDLDSAVAFAKGEGKADTAKLGITGFCWGGRIVWLYDAHNPAVKAGVAWYGPLVRPGTELQPKNPIDLVKDLHGPVLGLYGGADTGISQESVDKMRAALKTGSAAAMKSQIDVYPDTPHAFNADYRPSYRKEPAEDGWKKALAWFKANGVT